MGGLVGQAQVQKTSDTKAYDSVVEDLRGGDDEHHLASGSGGTIAVVLVARCWPLLLSGGGSAVSINWQGW